MRILSRTRSAASVGSTSEHLIPSDNDMNHHHTAPDSTDAVSEDLDLKTSDEIEPKHHYSRLEIFIFENPSVPVAFVLGTLMCVSVISYTEWLSHKVLRCPEWSVGCNVSPFVTFNKDFIAIIQGVATVFFSAGLAIMAYTAQCLAEAAIWPMLKLQPFSVEGIDKYLNIVRGSVFLVFGTKDIALTGYSRYFLLLTSLLILAPLSAGPLVGLAYDRSDVLFRFSSIYTRGGGAARLFAQDSPPVSLGSESMSAYISWAMRLSDEPLPEFRNYMVDRARLAQVGNITVNAVYTKLDVDCQGFTITEFKPINNSFGYFSTKMAVHDIDGRIWNSSDHVVVKLTEGLAIWADDYRFISRNKSSLQTVFAAINGSIEGGTTTILQNPQGFPTTIAITAVVCDIAVEFMDRVLKIAGGGPPLAPKEKMTMVSSVDTMHIEFANNTDQKSPENTLNENALWFAAAPMVVCPSVEGAQPLYTREIIRGEKPLPVPYTNGPYRTSVFEHDKLDHNWTLDSIKHFVNVSVGAVGQACSRNFQSVQQERNATVISLAPTRKLDPLRVLYLIIPLATMFVGCISLLVLNVILHNKESTSYMHMATLAEIIAHHSKSLATSGPTSQVRSRSRSESPSEADGRARFSGHDMGLGLGKRGVREESVELREYERASSDDPDRGLSRVSSGLSGR